MSLIFTCLWCKWCCARCFGGLCMSRDGVVIITHPSNRRYFSWSVWDSSVGRAYDWRPFSLSRVLHSLKLPAYRTVACSIHAHSTWFSSFCSSHHWPGPLGASKDWWVQLFFCYFYLLFCKRDWFNLMDRLVIGSLSGTPNYEEALLIASNTA